MDILTDLILLPLVLALAVIESFPLLTVAGIVVYYGV
jgi:hypothetical protein